MPVDLAVCQLATCWELKQQTPAIRRIHKLGCSAEDAWLLYSAVVPCRHTVHTQLRALVLLVPVWHGVH